MRRLLLLRHAKTEHDAPSGQDQDRRLDDRGRIDAAAIGAWIGSQPPVPDRVLVSPAVRARQTWDIVREAMLKAAGNGTPEPHAEFVPELYGAEPTQLLQIVRMAATTDPRLLLVIAHNPGLHELALMLAGGGDAAARTAIADNMPTAGLAILDFDIDDWSDVAFRRGMLMNFLSPKLLRQTS